MIVFQEKDNCLRCVTKDINKWSILASISRYKYFYKKIICIGKYEELFTGFSFKSFDKHKDEIKIYQVEVYNRIKIKLDDAITQKPKEKKERLSGQFLLDYFRRIYEDQIGAKYIITHEMKYVNKFRKLMDLFYESELTDKHIKRYIKRSVYFGNHNGEVIYLDWLFNDNILQNYLLVAKGIKDITSVWRKLDISISSLEKKKIRYLMAARRFDNLEIIEKDICLKFYKKCDNRIYKELLTKHKKRGAFNAKVELFELLSKEYDIPVHLLLKKTKHDQNYFWYEYTKKQIVEALTT